MVGLRVYMARMSRDTGTMSSNIRAVIIGPSIPQHDMGQRYCVDEEMARSVDRVSRDIPGALCVDTFPAPYKPVHAMALFLECGLPALEVVVHAAYVKRSFIRGLCHISEIDSLDNSCGRAFHVPLIDPEIEQGPNARSPAGHRSYPGFMTLLRTCIANAQQPVPSR